MSSVEANSQIQDAKVPTYGDASVLNEAPPNYDDLTAEERERNVAPPRGQSDTIYRENKFGEIHRPSTDSDLAVPSASGSEAHFGESTPEKSEQYRSDEVYDENRFGEIGRADTFQEQPHLSDKLKGTAERLFGKITGNHELHDKGVSRTSKSPSPPR